MLPFEKLHALAIVVKSQKEDAVTRSPLIGRDPGGGCRPMNNRTVARYENYLVGEAVVRLLCRNLLPKRA